MADVLARKFYATPEEIAEATLIVRDAAPIIRELPARADKMTLTGKMRVMLIVVYASTTSLVPLRAQKAEQPVLSDLVAQLKSSKEDVRVAAAKELQRYGEAAESAVPALSTALEDKRSETLRLEAAVALSSIGANAKAAIPALLRSLQVESEPSDAVRNIVASSFGHIGVDTPPVIQALIRTLTTDRNNDVRDGAGFSLAELGSPALDAMLKVLKDPSRPYSQRSQVAASLGNGSFSDRAELVIPALIWAMKNSDGDIQSNAAESLARMGQKAVDPLIDTFRFGEPGVKIEAAFALGRLGAAASASVPWLIPTLKGDNLEVSMSAASALAGIGPPAAPAISELIAVVIDRNKDRELRAKCVEALGSIHNEAGLCVPVIIKSLTADDFVVRLRAAKALGQFGASASKSVPTLIAVMQEVQPNELIHREAAEALGHIGADAIIAAPALNTSINSDDPLVRRNSITALGQIANGVRDNVKPLPDSEIKNAIAALEVSLVALQKLSARSAKDGLALDDSRVSIAKGISTLKSTIDQRLTAKQRDEADKKRRRAYVLAGACAIVGSFAVAIVVSAQIRRRILIAFGRRWSFVTGNCESVVEVSLTRLVAKNINRPSPLITGFALNGWPPQSELIDTVRQIFTGGSNVLVIVASEAFHEPWAHVIGGPWSDGSDAVIAGQLCMVPKAAPDPPPAAKTISFASFGCSNAAGLDPLEAAEEELEMVSARFSRWGAEVHAPRMQATVNAVREGLQTSDIVHIAAHASTAGVHLEDGFMSSADIEGLGQIRCRLLVLSACEAGRLDENNAFVLTLVRTGVNVLAAVRVVRDYACQMFFEEFYGALLPGRKAEGIAFGTAVRSATERIQRRLKLLELSSAPDTLKHGWKRSVDSFILYGDPSVHIKLGVPSTKSTKNVNGAKI
jgi:HEAT repeat protein